jgi:hypothetical protein
VNQTTIHNPFNVRSCILVLKLSEGHLKIQDQRSIYGRLFETVKSDLAGKLGAFKSLKLISVAVPDQKYQQAS